MHLILIHKEITNWKENVNKFYNAIGVTRAYQNVYILDDNLCNAARSNIGIGAKLQTSIVVVKELVPK